MLCNLLTFRAGAWVTLIISIVLLGACSSEQEHSKNEVITMGEVVTRDQSSLIDEYGDHDAQTNESESLLLNKESKVEQREDFSDAIDDVAVDEIDYSEDYEAQEVVTFNSEFDDGVLRWNMPTDRPYAGAELTISGANGEVVVKSFAEGEAVELYGDLPDGLYGWESVVKPKINESVMAELRDVRATGDLAKQQQLMAEFRAQGEFPTEFEIAENRQSGAFIVRNGVITESLTDEPSDQVSAEDGDG